MSDEIQPREVVSSSAESEKKIGSVTEPEMNSATESVNEVSAASKEPVAETDATVPEGDAADAGGASEASEAAEVKDAEGVVDEAEPDGEAEPEAEPVAEAEAIPSVVSIEALEKSKPSFGERLGTWVNQARGLFAGRMWLLGVILAVLVVGFLFLPPVSLAERISSGGGYETLNSDTPSLERDGMTLRINGEAKKLRMRVDTIPLADFTAETLPKELQPALESLPQHLTPKSPYYQIEVRGKESGPADLVIDIPNAAEPWETLDLYTWNGEAWLWHPCELDRDAMVLTTHVAELPPSVMVMQSGRVQQRIVTDVDALPEGESAQVLDEVDVTGMLIGTLGGLTGDATQLPIASQSADLNVVPVVRNWVPGRDANWMLVRDMIVNEEERAAHVQNLLGLVQSGGYTGVVLDYRAGQPEDRDGFSRFVEELSAAFHEANLWVAVVVDTPQESADGEWNAGGYDWEALGKAADQIRFAMPLDPQAYKPGGSAESLLEWAMARVERYKLMPIFSTLSTDGEQVMTLNDILAPLGDVRLSQTFTESVKPGTTLRFELGEALNVESDSVTGATFVSVGGSKYWLGIPSWLYGRMSLADRYHLGGMGVRDLFDEGNFPYMTAAIADYKAQVEPSSYGIPEIVWEVTGPDGKTTPSKTALTQPHLTWSAPTITGTYTIAASVMGQEKGAVEVDVNEPQPLVEDVDDEGEDDGETADTEDEEDTDVETTDVELDVLTAAFVTDVSVPDYTQFEKGEKFTKTWRMRNAGGKDWPENTVLVFSSGEQMCDTREVEVGAVAAGETVDISVEMTAPDADGTHKGVWRLQSGGKDVANGGVMVVIKVGEEKEPEQVQAPPANDTPVDNNPGPIAPVSGGGFELGGHVRDYGLPYGDKMHYSGMNWTKTQVHFGQGADHVINVSHANGFNVQLSALGGAGMVVEPGFEDNFAQWVAGLAAAGADAIEIWNEPNIEREWLIGHISPQAYTNLLCKSYRAIKAANPNTAVISAAPAPTGYFGGCSPNGCDDLYWMQGLAAAGAANCMDYIGAHHNAGATSPSASSGHPADGGGRHHSWYFLPQTRLYYSIFGNSRKIFYTEMGYASQEGVPGFSDQFAWARGINNAQQAQWLAEAASLGSSTGMVRCIIVWNIDFVRYGYDPQDGFAIIRPGGSCPACDALHGVMGSR